MNTTLKIIKTMHVVIIITNICCYVKYILILIYIEYIYYIINIYCINIILHSCSSSRPQSTTIYNDQFIIINKKKLQLEIFTYGLAGMLLAY